MFGAGRTLGASLLVSAKFSVKYSDKGPASTFAACQLDQFS